MDSLAVAYPAYAGSILLLQVASQVAAPVVEEVLRPTGGKDGHGVFHEGELDLDGAQVVVHREDITHQRVLHIPSALGHTAVVGVQDVDALASGRILQKMIGRYKE